MLKGHPKGLLVAFFSNMGERFGFYTMMAILVLFLQAKYGLAEDAAGEIYSWFYFGIYALALIGGIIADASRKYKTVILFGIIIMFAGYILMAVPGNPLALSIAGLAIIAFGNGLFKGNLQAVVGQLYDDPKYEKVRDTAFMIFYMGINVGALFAPHVANGIRNWYLKSQGFIHDGSLPALSHAYLNGTLDNTEKFQTLADKVSGSPVSDLGAFANQYLEIFSKGYNYAFAIAAFAMVISLIVYIVFNKHLPNVQKVVQKAEPGQKIKSSFSAYAIALVIFGVVTAFFYFVVGNLGLGLAVGLFLGFVAIMFQLSTKEERPKVNSLLLVFLVVIFFWMSFHQNGLTLTFFARDYTVQAVGPFTNIFFNLWSLLSFFAAIGGLLLLFNKVKKTRLYGLILAIGGGILTFFLYRRFAPQNAIEPEIFQAFNPAYIVFLTFPIMAVFAWLRNRNLEPSTPKKIGIGMIIASVGFVLMLVASLGLISPHELQYVENGVTKFNPVPDTSRVSAYWLISTYFILTIAELFLSPMGLSFVSKVAPVRFQGMMQAGWLLATAVGNKLLSIGSDFWGKLDLWQLWAIFITCCIASALFIFSIMKRLENSTK